MYSSKEISTIIKISAQDKKITVKQLLEKCKINKGFIYDLEHKSTYPSCDKISRIADCLEVSVDYLLGREGERQSEKDKKITVPIKIEDGNRQKLLNNYDNLNDGGQGRLLDFSEDLVLSGRYIKNNQLFGLKEA